MAFQDKESQIEISILIDSIQIKVCPIKSEHAIRKQDCLQRSSKPVRNDFRQQASVNISSCGVLVSITEITRVRKMLPCEGVQDSM